MDIKQELKVMIVREGMNFTTFAKKLSEKTGKKYTVQGIYNKFGRKSLRFEDVLAFCEFLGYEIKFEKKS